MINTKMIKVSDYIVEYLVEKGIKDVFMISGGGAMHLNDSIGRDKRIRYICNHHEQASAIAAEGYFRASDKMCAVVVTSGPGGTNTITGVIGQWLDSIPALYLSGQVKQQTTIESCRHIKLRQLGDQEINITDIIRPVTKYAAFVKNPLDIKYHLDRAMYLARHGRPGPVWLDIPLDIQASMIDTNKLRKYNSAEDEIKFNKQILRKQVRQVIEILKKSQRPVLLAGHGIRISQSQQLLLDVIRRIGIPVLTTFSTIDIIPSNHSLFAGRIGTVGTRSGNFALQNSDLLISVGSRNNIRQISYNWQNYARAAIKVIVDIDQAELKKPTIKPDIAIYSDAHEFLLELQQQIKKEELPDWEGWIQWGKKRQRQYPIVLPEYWRTQKLVNHYCFVETLTKMLKNNAVVVAGNGAACVSLFQAGIIKKNQRMFWNSGCASMGYDLPAAIGACLATGKKPVVCLAGDGSLQMNIQELQTVIHQRLPIKLFVLNNDGYLSIKQTQDTFFEGRRTACNPSCGVTFPDILKVAKAYGLPTERINRHKEMEEKIRRVLQTHGPVICEVCLLPEQKFSPKVASEKKPDGRIISKPLEDMYPFLPREEFKKNMIIPQLEES